MTTIKNILETIDTSKTEKKFVDFYEMCETQFNIFDVPYQPENNIRLTYCYYHRWICTDTEVGVRVWYFDNKPVCISYKPYRKASEEFGWLSKEDFDNVREYMISLMDEEEFPITLITDETTNEIIKHSEEIPFKKFEEKYIK